MFLGKKGSPIDQEEPLEDAFDVEDQQAFFRQMMALTRPANYEWRSQEQDLNFDPLKLGPSQNDALPLGTLPSHLCAPSLP